MRSIFRKILLVIFLLIFLTSLYGGEKRVVTLFFTDSNNGMLKHCDCPVDDRGGLARRKTLFDSLKKTERNYLLLDTGNFLSSYRRLKWDKEVFNIYKRLGYAAVNVGSYELKYGLPFFYKISHSGIDFVSANLIDQRNKELITLPYKREIIEGKSFLILGLISSKAIALVPNSHKNEIEIVPYVFSLKTILKKMEKDDPIIIVLSQLTEKENLFLIDLFSQKIGVILGNCSRDYSDGWYRTYKNTILAKAGVGGKTIGKLRMVFNKDWNRSDYSVDFIPVGNNLKENLQVVRLLNQWHSE